jgi:hypothetical protein
VRIRDEPMDERIDFARIHPGAEATTFGFFRAIAPFISRSSRTKAA